jgi:hypothetical protein
MKDAMVKDDLEAVESLIAMRSSWDLSQEGFTKEDVDLIKQVLASDEHATNWMQEKKDELQAFMLAQRSTHKANNRYSKFS